MKVIDNTPIGQPAVGKLVTERSYVKELKDCCLYVLPSNEESLFDRSRTILSMLLEQMGRKGILNFYSIEKIEQFPSLDNTSVLGKTLLEEKATFLMPLNTPSISDKKYLIVHSEESALMKDIPLMLYTSERITKKNMIDVMVHQAIEDSETFFKRTEHLWSSDMLIKTLAANQVGTGIHPTFGMSASKALLKKALGEGVEFTHKTKIDLQQHFAEDIDAYKHNKDSEELYARIQLVIGSIAPEDILKYFLSVPKEELTRFQNHVSAQAIAEKSKLKIQVRRVRHSDVHKKNDGHYRIFFVKNDKEIQIHFGRKSSFVLYIILLLDIYNKESVDSIDLRNFKEQFEKIFQEVYGYDEGNEYFKTLYGKGTSEQELLRHCFSDIRQVIPDICKLLDESPSPYLVEDAKSHLHVLKENIEVDERLLNTL